MKNSDDETEAFEEDIYGPLDTDLIAVAEDLIRTSYHESDGVLEALIKHMNYGEVIWEEDYQLFRNIVISELLSQICGSEKTIRTA